MIKDTHAKHNKLLVLLFLGSIMMMLAACSQEKSEQEMLDSAKAYLEDGELNAAAIELRNTLQKNKDNAEARYLLGSLGLKLDYLSSAEKEFRQAAQSGWDAQQTQLQLARTLLARNKPKDLLKEIKPDDSWSPATKANITALRALAEADTNKTEEARATLKDAAAYDQDAIEVLKASAQLQLEGILKSNALDTIDHALSLYPDDAELLQLHASYDLEHDKLERASETLQKIIVRDAGQQLSRAGRIARIDMARIQISQGQLDPARKTLKPLLAKSNNDPVANYLMSLLEFDNGDFEKAEMHMRRLLKTVPDDVQSQELMGNIKFLLQDYDQAAHHLTASLNYSPDNLLIYKLLARSYAALNKPAKAEFIINKALQIKPDDGELLTMLGQLKINEGNRTAGINTIKKAIELNPSDATLYQQLAIAYIEEDKLDKAEAAIKKFESLSDDHEEASKLSIRAAMKADDTDQAVVIANQLLKDNPDDPEVLALNGNLQVISKNYPLARDYFNKALKLQQELPAATIGLARLEEETGNFDKAIAYYETLARQNKGGVIPKLALSAIAEKQHRSDDMLFWLEQARSTSPADIRSRAILANHYLQQSDLVNANKYILEAIEIAPENPELLLLHGNILVAQQHYDEALVPLEKLINIAPGSSDARLLLGSTYLHLQKYGAARKVFLSVLNKQADNMTALSLLSQTARESRDFAQSMDYARRMQTIQPKDQAGYLQEGLTWLAQQDYGNAYASLNKAWSLQKSGDTAELLYQAAKHQHDFDDAIKPLLVWLDEHPDDYMTRLNLAYAYLDTGRNDEAVREYRSVLDNDADNTTALNNLAWLLSLQNDPEALDYAEHAFRLSPNDPGVIDTYGWVLLEQDKVEQSLDMLELAINMLPDNPEVQYHYAAALIRSGETERGRSLLRRLLNSNTVFPGREQAENLLRTVSGKT